MTRDILNFLEINRKNINDYAIEYLNRYQDIPKELKESIIYSLVNDGKKLRPILFLLLLDTYKIDYRKFLDIALAIELIHTYSLVHDDLPAMDNDDYRWGKKTNHKVFGDNLAILTGDAMQTLAYEIITNNSEISDSVKVKLVSSLAKSSGLAGMIAGQVYDVKQANYTVDADYLKRMHYLKTGKLLTLPLEFAAYIADKANELNDLINFGRHLGIAYQIKDDILDYYGDFDTIGKMPSDEDMITYLSFYGIEECELLLEEHTNEAKKIAKILDNDSLLAFADLLLKRKK